jgi:hypothetical protein
VLWRLMCGRCSGRPEGSSSSKEERMKGIMPGARTSFCTADERLTTFAGTTGGHSLSCIKEQTCPRSRVGAANALFEDLPNSAIENEIRGAHPQSPVGPGPITVTEQYVSGQSGSNRLMTEDWQCRYERKRASRHARLCSSSKSTITPVCHRTQPRRRLHQTSQTIESYMSGTNYGGDRWR